MPEDSKPDDSPNSAYRSRMSSLGLDTTPQQHNPRRAQDVFIGVVAGVLTYVVLAVLIQVLIGGIIGSVLMLVGLVVAVVAGVRVYRLLQRRFARIVGEEEE